MRYWIINFYRRAVIWFLNMHLISSGWILNGVWWFNILNYLWILKNLIAFIIWFEHRRSIFVKFCLKLLFKNINLLLFQILLSLLFLNYLILTFFDVIFFGYKFILLFTILLLIVLLFIKINYCYQSFNSIGFAEFTAITNHFLLFLLQAQLW